MMKKRLFQKEVLCVYVKKQMCFYAYIKTNKVTLKSSFIAKFMLLKEAISQSLEYWIRGP